MGIFGKKKAAPQPVSVGGDFQFRVDDAFSINAEVLVFTFTGTVETGSLGVGLPATLEIGESILLVEIGHVEARRHKKPVILNPGDRGGIGIEGLDIRDLPTKALGDRLSLDIARIKGAVIRSRRPADTLPKPSSATD
jgi:hypothetical protein